MKTFTVAVAMILITFICVQSSTVVPAAEGPELTEAPTEDSLLAVDRDMPEDSLNTMFKSVQMRRRRRRCRFCCGCCPNMIGCGTCCKF